MTWFTGALIDPSLPLDEKGRREVARAAWSRWLNAPRNVAIYTSAVVGLLFAYLFVPDLVEPMLGGRRWWFTLVWLALYVAALAGLFAVFRRIGLAPCVFAELRARGHDVCPACGYPLAGLPLDRGRCPECGVPR